MKEVYKDMVDNIPLLERIIIMAVFSAVTIFAMVQFIRGVSKDKKEEKTRANIQANIETENSASNKEAAK